MEENNKKSNQGVLAGAVLIVGVMIAGAILLRGGKPPALQPKPADTGIPVTTASLAPVGAQDRIKGSPQAKVTLILYEDFQCPFCGAVNGSQSNTALLQSLKQRDPTWAAFMPGVNEYIKNGTVQFVYRDWAFLGAESTRSAEAARCAGDQGKFWEYHDYLYGHQNGENQGNFSDTNLKSFSQTLGLNTVDFNKCFDGSKYAQAVADSKTEGMAAGVTGTPKGFILRDGKIASTIDGAESFTTVKPKLDAALK